MTMAHLKAEHNNSGKCDRKHQECGDCSWHSSTWSWEGISKKTRPQKGKHILEPEDGPAVGVPKVVVGGVSMVVPDAVPEGPAPDPPAAADNWANPIEPGEARNTEYTFF